MNNYRSLVEASALWAAYGDALGFITELADEKEGVRWRAGTSQIKRTINWKRKVGGFNGAVIKFPAGAYSDDTQLRLATSRAISNEGFFDVEAFAKVELPVWSCYALGAGKGSKDAAKNLAKKNVRWNSNFFTGSKGGRDYTQSGGNGAAMRIQPHVWVAANKLPFSEIAKDVIRNSIVTHGHPHAIIGAVFHALCLHEILINGHIPEPEQWKYILEDAANYCLKSVTSDPDIATVWLYEWEKRASKSFQLEVSTTLAECIEIMRIVERGVCGLYSYDQIVEDVGAADPLRRGMGTLTAILALAIAYLNRNEPIQALLEAANCLRTDTDTIATMAGALLGPINKKPQSFEIQDQSLIIEEANKLVDINEGKRTRKFQYPSLLTWQPPLKANDAVIAMDGKYLMPGLGLISLGEPIARSSNNTWCWGSLTMGQTVLVKLPDEVPIYREDKWNIPFKPYVNMNAEVSFKKMKNPNPQFSLLSEPTYPSQIEKKELRADKVILDANTAFDLARQSEFSAQSIGELLLQLSSNSDFAVESASSFAALISKALLERKKKKAGEGQ